MHNYNQQISEIQDDGKKKVLEKSWFERGNKILVCGYRQGDIFRALQICRLVCIAQLYADKGYNPDGTIQAAVERCNVNE